MTKKLYVIYVPGLGDSSVSLQRRAVNSWHLWGVQAELFQMNWADKELWQIKFNRLLKRIDQLIANGFNIGLVGASAGASAVINAYAARKDHIVGCVLIAGKVNHPETIGQNYYLHNPAFVTSVDDCQKSLALLNDKDRTRILSRYAAIDETVNKSDSLIPGAQNQRVLIIGHAITIGYQITFGATGFIKFLKRQTLVAR